MDAKTKTAPDETVSSSQASFLARHFMLGGTGDGAGFSRFVPGFDTSTEYEMEKPWDRAARLLMVAGATRQTVSEAIEYLKGAKPTTEDGKSYRLARGEALVFGRASPEPVPGKVPARVATPAKKPSGQLAQAEMELALAEVRLAQTRLALLRAK